MDMVIVIDPHIIGKKVKIVWIGRLTLWMHFVAPPEDAPRGVRPSCRVSVLARNSR
jgi:hypothetical protein